MQYPIAAEIYNELRRRDTRNAVAGSPIVGFNVGSQERQLNTLTF